MGGRTSICVACFLAIALDLPLGASGDEIVPLSASVAVIPNGEARDRIDRWRSDLAYIMKELPRRHPDPFTRISKKAFKERAEALAVAMPNMNENEMAVGLMQLVSAIGDSHTTLRPSRQLRLPIEAKEFGEGVYVIAASKPIKGLIGKRIVAVEHHPWKDVREKLASVMAAETDGWRSYALCQSLVLPQILNGLGLSESTTKVSLSLMDGKGRIEDVVIDSIPGNPSPRFSNSAGKLKTPDYAQQREGAWNWYAAEAENSMLYFRYGVCADESGQRVDDLCGKVIDEIDKAAPRRILIDLRGNTGGSSGLLARMVRYLERRADLKRQFYVAVDGATFSSGLINAYELKKAGGIIIGEPTGSPLNHFGYINEFVLPNSGLKIVHSTRRFRLDRDYAEGEPLRVDVTIEPKVSEWFAGTDPVIGYILGVKR